MSTRVIPHVMSVFVFLKSFARSLTVRETVKKSKASHDHAKKATLSRPLAGRMCRQRSKQAHKEEKPMLEVERGQKLDWIRRLGHRRLERRNPRCDVSTDAHILRSSALVDWRRISSDGLLLNAARTASWLVAG